jgi:hypothetical protein
MPKHSKSSILKAIRNAPPRASMSLLEWADGLDSIRAGMPSMSVEDLAKFVRLDIRFVRRVIAIAGRVNREPI